MTCPRLTIIAGANGCGKSTLTSRSSFIYKTPLLDPDAISKALQPSVPGASAVAAARQVLISAGKHIDRGESFAVETTLAGKSYLQMMVDARTRGFEVVLVYIGTENVEINLARIRNRVLAGGHDVRRKMSGGATNEALTIFRSPFNVQTTPFCSTIQPKRVTALSQFSACLEISGSSLFQIGQRQVGARPGQIGTADYPRLFFLISIFKRRIF